MEKIEGVTVEAFMEWEAGKESLEVREEDGYIGKLFPGQTAGITVRVFPENIYGFSVDGKKNVVLKKDWAAEGRKRGYECVGKSYQIRMVIKESLYGIPHTQDAENSMRLLWLSVGLSGVRIEVWEVSLTSQGGHFYLRMQKQYSGRLFKSIGEFGKIKCSDPRIGEWPQLMDLIKKLWS